jgi:Tfp pilus assembly protein PilF
MQNARELAAGLTTDELILLNLRVEAEEFHALGRERHAAGDVDEAAAYYELSLELYPTAEAHTALAVTLAARGRWEDAIVHCKQAITLDPDLGNAYNDLGVYLAETGKRQEAMAYLDQAITAPRYDCRHYPHYHRGRLLEQQGRFGEARDAYRASLDLQPDWPPALSAWRRALGWLN